MTATRDVCSAHGAAEWPGPWLGRPGFCLSSVSHEWRHRNKLAFRPRIWVAGLECPENVIKIPARRCPPPVFSVPRSAFDSHHHHLRLLLSQDGYVCNLP